MYVNPPPVFATYLWVVPDGQSLFCALWKSPGSIGGRNGFIFRIFSCWAAIRLEGEMSHNISEVNLGFGHFIRDSLEGFQGDAAGY